jgi:hypothetical protein
MCKWNQNSARKKVTYTKLSDHNQQQFQKWSQTRKYFDSLPHLIDTDESASHSLLYNQAKKKAEANGAFCFSRFDQIFPPNTAQHVFGFISVYASYLLLYPQSPSYQ